MLRINGLGVAVMIGLASVTAMGRPAAAESLSPSTRCFTDREVRFESKVESISIAGTLSMPSGQGPHPAVLMITGNGPHTRDQTISNSPMFAMLGQHLARRGLAVLRTDSRGHGKSTGPDDWEQTTTADRVEDNRAALEFLRSQEGVVRERVVLLGHSEGAMIAAELAATGARPALSVLLATSALPGDEVFARQRADSLRRRGSDEEVAEAVYGELLRFAAFLQGDRSDRREFESIALDFLAAHGVPEDQLDPELAQGLLEGFLTAPWYRHFVAHDPRQSLNRIDTPVLAIFAGADQNVPWPQHMPSLVDALSTGPATDVSATVLADQDHFFLEFEGARLEEHRPGEMTVADELLELLDAELGRRGLRSDCDTTR